MAISANLAAALAKPSAVTGWLVTVSLFLESAKRYSFATYSSLGTGQFDGRLLSVSGLSDSWSDRSGNVASREVEIRIADPDRDWAKRFEGTNSYGIIDSPVTIDFGEISVVAADWSRRFSGVICNVGFHEPFVCTLRVRTNDITMRRKVPHARWRINLADFPQASADVLDSVYPLLYGDLDSRQHGAKGAVQCLHVDALNHRYLVCAGIPKAVPRVYKDGVLQTSGYAITSPAIGGKQTTMVDFTTSQGDAVITADVQGYSVVSNGTGALIEEPANIIAHLLSNFVFGDWFSGSWLATTTMLDSTALGDTNTWLINRGYKNAKAITTLQTGYDLLREWLVTNEVRARWNGAGTLALGYFDPTMTDIYNASMPRLRQGEAYSYETDDQNVVTSFVMHYAYLPAEGQYRKSLEVQDPWSSQPTQEDVNMPFGTLS